MIVTVMRTEVTVCIFASTDSESPAALEEFTMLARELAWLKYWYNTN